MTNKQIKQSNLILKQHSIIIFKPESIAICDQYALGIFYIFHLKINTLYSLAGLTLSKCVECCD
ncbi:hypothetical protein VN23_18620 [Janthinobacterium sp. B9-8]|nr:hypothetical protein VN23_18620 [Janthinobacterium sp. B9-8]